MFASSKLLGLRIWEFSPRLVKKNYYKPSLELQNVILNYVMRLHKASYINKDLILQKKNRWKSGLSVS